MQRCEHNSSTEACQAVWVTERDVASLTGISLSTLRKYRLKNQYLAYVKIGRSVRYRLSDIIAFMDAHRIEPRG